MKTKSLIVLCTATLMGCQAITDVGGQAVAGLQQVNDVLSGKTISGNTLDNNTSESVVSALSQTKTNKDVSSLFAEAKPTMTKVLALIACQKESQVQTYTDEGSVGMKLPLSPIRQMNMHKSGCVHVARVDGIKKITANSFVFRVLYISPQSEETYLSRYIAVKQPNGDWMFRWSAIGY